MNKKQVRKDRGAKYGDSKINMRAFTHAIQSMVEQSIQQKLPRDLPDNFGALVMVVCKVIRECYRHDPDNILDMSNYADIAREIAEEYDDS